jgi:DNA polymerase-1
MFRDVFREIWLVDYEFVSLPGERPDPVCVVALEFYSGHKVRLWRDQFGRRPPYSTQEDSLFVAYFASAEFGCHLALNWPMPAHVLDLFAEFRNHTNGLPTVAGNGLLGALAYYGLDGIGADEKKGMQDRINRGGPWIGEEKTVILDYCESDVLALVRLLLAMQANINLQQAVLRGRYLPAIACMEFAGVPIDTNLLDRLRPNWKSIQIRLISEIDSVYKVFDGRTFKLDRFERLLQERGIAWPRLESGRLSLDKTVFRDRCLAHPELEDLRQVRQSLSEMRLEELTVGRDGRNRCLLSPFGARSSRNTPSNTRFIFGPSTWLRSLIKAPPGYGLAYIDWVQQEFGIAAALSGDPGMITAYHTGDAYVALAVQAGAAPPYATKKSHRTIREVYKQVVLGTNYGMGYRTLAFRINQPDIVARQLLQHNRENYFRFWQWSDDIVDHAMLHLWQQTVFGWKRQFDGEPNPRSIRNFPMQANGAEMLRLACCLGTEAGIEICAPVHDAVLICAPVDRLETDIARMRGFMEEASRIVLAGFTLQTEAERFPDRYSDERGARMFNTVMNFL